MYFKKEIVGVVNHIRDGRGHNFMTSVSRFLQENVCGINPWKAIKYSQSVTPGGRLGGVLRISSDGNDRRIFWV